MRDLLDRAFGGSSSKLVMQALAAKRASAEELGDIRKADRSTTGRPAMTAIETLLRQPAAQAVGWALLQFVWQGALSALLTAALLRRCAGAPPTSATWSRVALALMLTLPVVTASEVAALARPTATGRSATAASAEPGRGQPRARRSLGVAAAAAPIGAEASARHSPVDRRMAIVRVEPLLPTSILVWLAGVAMLSLRLLSGWMWVQRLKSHGARPPRPAGSDGARG